MPLTVDELHDFIRLVETHPEWRAELRRLVLTEELLSLPAQVATLTDRVISLVEAQQRTEVQVATLVEAQQRTEVQVATLVEAQQRTEVQVATLVEAQQRTEVQVATLVEAQQRTEAQVATLVEAQQRTEVQVATLVEAQQRTEVQVATLVEAQQRTEVQVATLVEAQQRTEVQVATLVLMMQTLTDDVGNLKGKSLEADYRAKGHAYFSRVVRRPHVLTSDEIVFLVEAARDRGILSDADTQVLYAADVLVRGRRLEDGTEVYLVVEVSWSVDPHDVERAVQRAALLAHTGVAVIPVVAGARLTAEAGSLARRQQVWQLTNGHTIPPT